MKILHTSDLHGQYEGLLRLLSGEVFDLWVDTGDFFPNKTRGDVWVEGPYQTRWFTQYKDLGPKIRDALNGTPVVCVSGNHDYVDLAELLHRADVVAHNVADGPVDILGLRFAGFREIPWIAGEWAGEMHDISPLVEKALSFEPDILVTHSPPMGILDKTTERKPGGVASITTSLSYKPHKVQAHLFGHIHEQGQRTKREIDVLFSNAATGHNVLYL